MLQKFSSHLQNFTFVCIGALVLTGCMTPTKPTTHEAAGNPEAVTFYPAQNPIWAHLQVGRMVCAQGITFDISRADEGTDLDISWQGQVYTLSRIPTTTGAYRYEDSTSGIVLIQIPAKQFLLDTKKGQRLADECRAQ